MTDRQVSIGVLGCSNIAHRSVLPAIVASPDLRLSAIASRDRERAQAFTNRFGGRPCTYDELVAMDLDAVYVPLPVGLHHPWTRRLLEAGKHVIVEKTFTARHAEAVDLVELAAAQKLVVMEALMYRFHPLHAELRALVAGGAVGAVRHVDAYFGIPPMPAGDIRYERALGGGLSLDNLVYPLSLCQELLGGVPASCDVAMTFDPGSGIDLRGVAQARWSDATAHLAWGVGYFYRNTVTVWGDAGMISLDRAFTRPPDLAGELVLRTASGSRTVTVAGADHFAAMLAHFVARVRGQADASPAEGEALLARMGAIERIRAAGGCLG